VRPPYAILLENVDGFQHSKSADRLFSVLATIEQQQRSNGNDSQQRGEGGSLYLIGHFLLQPTQAGLPNDRPRYYCLALLRSRIRELNNEEDPLLRRYFSEISIGKEPTIQRSLEELNVVELNTLGGINEQSNRDPELPPMCDFLDEDDEELASLLRVPSKLLVRDASWCFDIITPESRRSACFTSGYGKFVRGTGSILYDTRSGTEKSRIAAKDLTLRQPGDRSFDAGWVDNLDEKRLRYLSGAELARLFGFDPSFRFPSTTTHKQHWKLMGNSLNVRVAARLCRLVLRVVFPDPTSAARR